MCLCNAGFIGNGTHCSGKCKAIVKTIRQTKFIVSTKHTKLNATKKGRHDIKRFLSTVCNFYKFITNWVKLEICHIFIITMNLATLLEFLYTQVTHDNMSPFPDATGLITFVLAGCKLNKYSLMGLVCRRVIRSRDMVFWFIIHFWEIAHLPLPWANILPSVKSKR